MTPKVQISAFANNLKTMERLVRFCGVGLTAASLLTVLHEQKAYGEFNRELTSVKKSDLMAFSVPHFSPLASLDSGILYLYIPEALIEAAINEVLRRNEGSLKDTRREKASLSNLRVDLVNNGFKVSGDWKIRQRFVECAVVNPITGDCIQEGSWVSDSGRFTADFRAWIYQGILKVEGEDVEATGEIWSEQATELIFHKFFQGGVAEQIQANLQTINGLSLKELIADYGSQTVASLLEISQNQARREINKHASSLRGNIASNGLRLSVPLTNNSTANGRRAVYGTILLKPEAADWLSIPAAELGNPLTPEELFRAVNDWARSHGYLSGFPNFHQVFSDGSNAKK